MVVSPLRVNALFPGDPAEGLVGSRDPATLLPSPKLLRCNGKLFRRSEFHSATNCFHGRARWLRRHFRIGDNMARPTGVACKPTLIRSTAGDGSGGINSSRHTKP